MTRAAFQLCELPSAAIARLATPLSLNYGDQPPRSVRYRTQSVFTPVDIEAIVFRPFDRMPPGSVAGCVAQSPARHAMCATVPTAPGFWAILQTALTWGGRQFRAAVDIGIAPLPPRAPHAGFPATRRVQLPSINPDAASNRLLAALPHADRLRVLAGCELVELVFADVLMEPGEDIRHVYFPTDSYISLITPTRACASIEVGLVGDEGMLGVSLLLGVNVAPLQALVQGPGPALRMDAAVFHRALDRSPVLRVVAAVKARLFAAIV